MAFDIDRNQVLLSLRDRPEGVNSPGLIEALGLPRETVERHLLYCADYGLTAWPHGRGASRLAV